MPSRFLGPRGEVDEDLGFFAEDLTTSPFRLRASASPRSRTRGAVGARHVEHGALAGDRAQAPGCLGSAYSPTNAEGAALAPRRLPGQGAPTAVAAAMDLKVTEDVQLSFDEASAATGPMERFELMLMRPLEGTRVGVSPGRAMAFMRASCFARTGVRGLGETSEDRTVPRHRVSDAQVPSSRPPAQAPARPTFPGVAVMSRARDFDARRRRRPARRVSRDATRAVRRAHARARSAALRAPTDRSGRASSARSSVVVLASGEDEPRDLDVVPPPTRRTVARTCMRTRRPSRPSPPARVPGDARHRWPRAGRQLPGDHGRFARDFPAPARRCAWTSSTP